MSNHNPFEKAVEEYFGNGKTELTLLDETTATEEDLHRALKGIQKTQKRRNQPTQENEK